MGSTLSRWIKFRGSMRVIKAAERIKDSESVHGETGQERRRP
jgi:hypothetical protein